MPALQERQHVELSESEGSESEGDSSGDEQAFILSDYGCSLHCVCARLHCVCLPFSQITAVASSLCAHCVCRGSGDHYHIW